MSKHPLIFTVVGARPQFVKAAMVSQELKKRGIPEILVHTGQHFDPEMSAVFFDELNLSTPTHHLQLGGASHGAMTGKMLEQLEALLLQNQPDWVLVYGDTNSTLAAALAAVKLHIPIAHVEAGMRSFNKKMPEEVNRVLVDHISTQLFVPSLQTVDLLEKEGISRGVKVVGDIMMDAVLQFQSHANLKALLQSFDVKPQQFLLVTLHRAENTDKPELLQQWLNQLAILGEQHRVIFPMHPRTRKAIEKHGLVWDTAAITVCEPLSYSKTLGLLSAAALLLTDSGGMQKEAYYLSTPCLTLRQETEWVETLEHHWNILVPEPDLLLEKAQQALVLQRPPISNIYGTGQTAKAIVDALLE